jgi:phosphatidylethanolamine/phosphatidyl-N-methylethanolamine N-methyltransferase
MSSTPEDAKLLFGMWLKNPRHIATFAPSSDALARHMARHVPPHGDRFVVELGAGTGAVTRALLAAGVARDKLVILERDATLAQVLRERFPGTRVIHGDATHLKKLLHVHGIDEVCCIVSSLPLLTLPPLTRLAVLRQSFRLLGSTGVFVQYTYSPFSPVSIKRRRQFGLYGRCVARVWNNLPPATVWTYGRERRDRGTK